MFACLLLSKRPVLAILCILMFRLSLFPFIQDTSPQVVSMDIFNYSTSKLVTSAEFYKAPSSLTLTRFHGCCSFFSVVRMEFMLRIVDHLDTLVNNHIILVFS